MLFKPALEAFLEEQLQLLLLDLVSAVRKTTRDTMNEARLAGKIEAYETFAKELERFAEEQLKRAQG